MRFKEIPRKLFSMSVAGYIGNFVYFERYVPPSISLVFPVHEPRSRFTTGLEDGTRKFGCEWVLHSIFV